MSCIYYIMLRWWVGVLLECATRIWGHAGVGKFLSHNKVWNFAKWCEWVKYFRKMHNRHELCRNVTEVSVSFCYLSQLQLFTVTSHQDSKKYGNNTAVNKCSNCELIFNRRVVVLSYNFSRWSKVFYEIGCCWKRSWIFVLDNMYITPQTRMLQESAKFLVFKASSSTMIKQWYLVKNKHAEPRLVIFKLDV